jgi:hypothetical protein
MTQLLENGLPLSLVMDAIRAPLVITRGKAKPGTPGGVERIHLDER